MNQEAPVPAVVSEFPKVSEAVRLVGWPCLVIPCREKAPLVRGWPDLRLDIMAERAFLASVEAAPSIGTVHGEVSGNLVCLDADSPEAVEALLALNGWLSETLAVEGTPGRRRWFVRVSGDYPDTFKIGKIEWRARKCQSIVSGVHPEADLYRTVNASPPVLVPYSRIVWPDSVPDRAHPKRVTSPAAPSAPTGTDPDPDPASGTQESKGQHLDALDASPTSPSSPYVPRTGEPELGAEVLKLVEECAVHAPGESSPKLWRLARGRLSLMSRGVPCPPLAMFKEWFRVSGPRLRPDEAEEDYWLKWNAAVERATVPLGEDAGIRDLWGRAADFELQGYSPAYFGVHLHRLGEFLGLLQEKEGDNPVFCSAEKLESLSGVPWQRMNQYFRLLIGDGVVTVAKKHTPKKARRVKFTGKFPLRPRAAESTGAEFTLKPESKPVDGRARSGEVV